MHRSAKFIIFPTLIALSAELGAQVITSTVPAVVGFVDVSTNGGTPVTPPPSDESEHNIVTTIGNPLFPAGNVRIGNNGVVVAGTTMGEIGFSNSQILPTGVPAGSPTGNGIICAYWDDLTTVPGTTGTSPTSIMWKEEAGVLYIMWKNESHQALIPFSIFFTITFEIQVFATPAPGAPWIQLLYPDTTFSGGGGFGNFNNGLSATVGYVAGTNPNGLNFQWSHNTASVGDSAVLSIFPSVIVPTSPAGPGSIRLDIVSGPPNGGYFLAATTTGGAYPYGWFFGLDISYGELAAEMASGFPFTGPLNSLGGATLGPFSGLPPGLTVYAVALGFASGSPVPTEISPAISHSIP